MNRQKVFRVIAGLLLLAMMAGACSAATPTPIPPTPMPPTAVPPTEVPPTAIPPTPTPLPTATAAMSGKEELGDLVLTVRSETGKPLEEDAGVFIFAKGQLLYAGLTKNGYYGAVLPSGNYDVAVVYPSTPEAGLLKKDLSVKGSDTAAAVFVLPPEGNLKVVVRAKNDMAPQKAYNVTITTGGREVKRSSGRSDPTEFRLSTGFVYDVAVKYGNEELQATGIRLKEDKTEEVKLVLPFSEADLAVQLRTKNGSVPSKSFGATVSYKGTMVASTSSTTKSFVATALRDDQTYLVTVEYEGQKWQQAGVTLNGGVLTEQSINLPWDEGVLAVIVRAGDKPLADSATVTVLDAAGREVASKWTADRYTVVLHAEKEYTVQVQYKNQPEQQRKIQVSADKLTEEKFNFTP